VVLGDGFEKNERFGQKPLQFIGSVVHDDSGVYSTKSVFSWDETGRFWFKRFVAYRGVFAQTVKKEGGIGFSA